MVGWRGGWRERGRGRETESISSRVYWGHVTSATHNKTELASSFCGMDNPIRPLPAH